MIERDFPCTPDGIVGAQSFLEEVCVSPKPAVILDEVASNIVRCSGATGFTLGLENSDAGLQMVFSDDGRTFDPLTETETPDITVAIADRKIGGLGIFMVRKMSKSVEYRREGNKNILSVVI